MIRNGMSNIKMEPQLIGNNISLIHYNFNSIIKELQNDPNRACLDRVLIAIYLL